MLLCSRVSGVVENPFLLISGLKNINLPTEKISKAYICFAIWVKRYIPDNGIY